MKPSSRKIILLAFLAAFCANHFRTLALKHLLAEVAFREQAAWKAWEKEDPRRVMPGAR